jgi:glycosyltransferase involved in cell wall biosynthesis
MTNSVLTGKTILIISHILPYPPAAGNEYRLLRLLNWLKEQDCKLVFLHNAAHLSDAEKSNVLTIVDSVYLRNDALFQDSWIESFVKRMKTKLYGYPLVNKLSNYRATAFDPSKETKKSLAPDELVRATRILCRKYKPFGILAEYIFTTPCLEGVPPNIVKLIDTHDMFCRRDKSEHIYCTPEEERNYLLRGDIIIAIQEEEAKLFRELVPERKVVTAGVDYGVADILDNSAVVPSRILVVGSDNPANVSGLSDFLRIAWPLIRVAVPESCLRIVGKLAGKVECDDDRVERVGWAKDIDQEYREACVVINPTSIGTGLKIKTVEALCRIKPLVSTENGVEGLPSYKVKPFIATRDMEAFAQNVIVLLTDNAKRLELQRNAHAYAKDTFSSRQVYAELFDALSAFVVISD